AGQRLVRHRREVLAHRLEGLTDLAEVARSLLERRSVAGDHLQHVVEWLDDRHEEVETLLDEPTERIRRDVERQPPDLTDEGGAVDRQRPGPVVGLGGILAGAFAELADQIHRTADHRRVLGDRTGVDEPGVVARLDVDVLRDVLHLSQPAAPLEPFGYSSGSPSTAWPLRARSSRTSRPSR